MVGPRRKQLGGKVRAFMFLAQQPNKFFKLKEKDDLRVFSFFTLLLSSKSKSHYNHVNNSEGNCINLS